MRRTLVTLGFVLAAVARDIERLGLALKVFVCYRPVRAVAHFLRWARDLRDVAAPFVIDCPEHGIAKTR